MVFNSFVRWIFVLVFSAKYRHIKCLYGNHGVWAWGSLCQKSICGYGIFRTIQEKGLLKYNKIKSIESTVKMDVF
jgi:hypothetical protein